MLSFEPVREQAPRTHIGPVLFPIWSPISHYMACHLKPTPEMHNHFVKDGKMTRANTVPVLIEAAYEGWNFAAVPACFAYGWQDL